VELCENITFRRKWKSWGDKREHSHMRGRFLGEFDTLSPI
jgi:hypothetical protein